MERTRVRTATATGSPAKNKVDGILEMLERKEYANNQNEKFWNLIPDKLDDYQIAIQGLELHRTESHVYEFSGAVFADGADGEFLVTLELSISRDVLQRWAGKYLLSVKIQTDLAPAKQNFYTINEHMMLHNDFSGLKYYRGHYWLSNVHVGTDFETLGKLVDTLSWQHSSLVSFWLSN